jgi:RNA polymerase-binding transcription factor DksA
MTKPKLADVVWEEHRKGYLQEYAEEHKDEISKNQRLRYAKKKIKKDARHCDVCGDPVPFIRHYSHYCCRECYLQAFEVYRIEIVGS